MALIKREQLENFLRKRIEENTGKTVKSFEFKVSSQLQGYGVGEHEVTVFEGVEVTFNEPEIDLGVE